MQLNMILNSQARIPAPVYPPLSASLKHKARFARLAAEGDAKGGPGMKRLLKFFSRNDRDNEPIEYGVIAAGLTVALVVVLAQIGGRLTTTF